SLPDEVIANRLGLVVLKSDVIYQELVGDDESTCDDHNDCMYTFDLSARCTGCGVMELVEVRAGNMISDDPKVYPIYPETPIVTLAGTQKIKLTAFAFKNIGSTNVRFSPVIAISFRELEPENQDDPNMLKVRFDFESRGHLEPQFILQKAREILAAKNAKRKTIKTRKLLGK
ncbi:MAG: hypothetical protein ACMG6E_06980, partial [Candidatus Roizmanbacteria bacterium]